jgi:type IV pilus assembly protein PilF
MRRPESAAAVVLLGACVALAGCSRLTFVKPSTERGDYDRVAPEYNVREDPREAARMQALQQAIQAEAALRAGRPADAERAAREALKLDPQSSEAHTLLGLLAERGGRAEEAGRHYAEAVRLAPRRGATLNNYAAWLCRNGREAESLPVFRRALADPGYDTPAAALANSGTCALRAGQPARAERDLRAALEYDPDNVVALETMARLSYQGGEYLQARAFSQRRLAAAPATAQVLLLASQIEQKLGDSAAAARYGRRLRAEFPNTPTPRGDASQQ